MDGAATSVAADGLIRLLDGESRRKASETAQNPSYRGRLGALTLKSKHQSALIRPSLDQLMVAIKDNDQENRAKSRRALAAELQRMVNTIVISRDIEAGLGRDPTEPSWAEALPSIPATEIAQVLKDYGVEVSIRYRNGEQQIVQGLTMRKIKLPASKQFSKMKNLRRFENN